MPKAKKCIWALLVQEKNRKLKATWIFTIVLFCFSLSKVLPKPQSLVKQSRILDTRKQIVSFSWSKKMYAKLLAQGFKVLYG